MQRADEVFRCAQLVTSLGTTPRSAEEMSELSVISNAGIAVRAGMILEAGRYGHVSSKYGGRRRDLGEVVVTPGLVDSHSHIVFSGSRELELGLKLSGKGYMDILESGGGILSTVEKTRRAGDKHLADESRERLDCVVAGGVTAVEIKSGYGLNLRDEVKMLKVARSLGSKVQTVPTYLGAHAFPPGRARNEYVDEIVDEHLPEVRRLSLSDYCDVFIEEGAFTVEEGRRILSTAARLGFRLTAHVDEFSDTGGAAMAAELGASSVSHLAFTPSSDFSNLAASGTIGVILPSTPLFSMSPRYPDARSMIDKGMSVAIGSDLSPNSWNQSLLLSCLLAVYNCRMKQEEVLTASTINSACAIGLGETSGTLEKGKRADFACFDVDDYRKLFYRYEARQIVSVFVCGRQVSGNRRAFEKTA